MNDYVPLLEALEGQFEQSLDELPDALRERVLRDFPMPWGKASADLRRSLAAELDAVHSSHNDEEPQTWQAFHRDKLALEEAIKHWDSVGTPTASDLDLKEMRLAVLRDELATMEKRLARGDFLEPQDAKSHPKALGHLNHDPELQTRANKIAQQRKSATGRMVTKQMVANILAKETGMEPSTVERRIRKMW